MAGKQKKKPKPAVPAGVAPAGAAVSAAPPEGEANPSQLQSPESTETESTTKKKGRKLTDDQQEDVIERTAIALGKGLAKHTIRKLIKKAFLELCDEECHWRTCDDYIVRARTFLIKQSEKSKDEHLKEENWFYVTMLADENTSEKGRFEARQGLSKTLGLDHEKTKTIRLEHTGELGLKAVEHDLDKLSVEELRQFKALTAKMAADAGEEVK